MKSRKVIGFAIVAVAVMFGAGILLFGREICESCFAQNPMNKKNVQSVVELVKEGKATLLDVRTDDEWNAGHALGAVHFDLVRLQNGELPPIPKDSAVYVYCRSGVRAAAAKEILEQGGYANVVNFGGLANWQAQGGAVEK